MRLSGPHCTHSIWRWAPNCSQTGRWSKTPLQVAPPYPASPTSRSHCPLELPLNRAGTLEAKRRVQVRTLSGPHGAVGPLLRQGQRFGHLRRNAENREGWTAGMMRGIESWDPPPPPFCPGQVRDIFLPFPHCPASYWSLPSARAQAHRLRYQLLGIKGACLYSKQALAHSESAHSKAAHVTAPPAQSPSGIHANLWLETFLNMSLAQRVSFPGLLYPGRPSQDFRGCREGTGWGQAGRVRRQPAETANHPRNIA